MKKIHPLVSLKTSVSLPQASYRRVRAARAVFARHGIYYSEQEIYRRLFKHFLRNWRGRGAKSNGLRRYNCEGKDYSVHPLYINQVLYAALWQRALHSGESVSRMLDMAIRVYLPRLMEGLLGSVDSGRVSGSNARYWLSRYRRRLRHYSDFFINYTCQTENNEPDRLRYIQNAEIIHKANLSPMQIWELIHTAA